MTDARTAAPAALDTSAAGAHALLLAEGVATLLRRPPARRPSARRVAALPAGRRFALARGPFMGILVPLAVLSVLVDGSLVTLFLHVDAPPAWRLPAHLFFVAIEFWTLAWAVGLRSATQHIPHVLTADALVLAVGFRTLARIPRAEVTGAHLVKGQPRDGSAAHGLRRREVARFQALDASNLLLTLESGHGPGPRAVALYVDEAAALREALLTGA